MERVDYNNLEFMEWAPNSEPRFKYMGQPFNGMALKYYPNGILSDENQHSDGYREGLQRSYYRNGSISTEYIWEHSRYNGNRRKWNEAGDLISDSIWELGHLITETKFDTDHQIAEQYNIETNLEKLRALNRDRELFNSLKK